MFTAVRDLAAVRALYPKPSAARHLEAGKNGGVVYNLLNHGLGVSSVAVQNRRSGTRPPWRNTSDVEPCWLCSKPTAVRLPRASTNEKLPRVEGRHRGAS